MKLIVLALAGLVVSGKAQDQAPEVSFTAPDGKVVKLAEYRGKKAVVLLFMRGFFGEFSCYFCSEQTKAYKAAYADLTGQGAEVLMVLPGAKDAKGYLEKVGTSDEKRPEPKFSVPYPVLYDKDFSACKALGIPYQKADDAFPVNKPATIVISKEGKILWRYDGKQPDDRPKVEAVMAVLKSGEPPSDAGAKPAAEANPAKPALAWVPYEKGLADAREGRKPILLDFYADW